MEWSFLFFFNSALLGVGLAMDAFSVSMANGLHDPQMSRRRGAQIAGTFAIFQAVMPMTGWVCVHTIVELFGMPAPAVLPAILLKSVLLAVGAGLVAARFQKVTLPLLLAVVLFYQLAGTLGEWALSGSLFTALQDFRIGILGMLLQVVGGYWVICKI